MASPYIPSQFEPRTRVYMACVNCRRRRIKCKSGDSGENPCKRCVKRGLRCEYMSVEEQRQRNIHESTESSFTANPEMYPGHHREAAPLDVDPRTRYTQPQPTENRAHRQNPPGPGAIDMHALPSGQGSYPGHIPTQAPLNLTPTGGAYYHPSLYGSEMNRAHPTGYEGHNGPQLAYPPFQWGTAQPLIVYNWIAAGPSRESLFRLGVCSKYRKLWAIAFVSAADRQLTTQSSGSECKSPATGWSSSPPVVELEHGEKTQMQKQRRRLTDGGVVSYRLAAAITSNRKPTIEDLYPIVVEDGLGLRPHREQGICLEVEWVESNSSKAPVVFHYGLKGKGQWDSHPMNCRGNGQLAHPGRDRSQLGTHHATHFKLLYQRERSMVNKKEEHARDVAGDVDEFEHEALAGRRCRCR
ncbi:hypothetical protein FB45DRAFT_1080049 [Roridomyces roridus]|uniref:Zn(2)-C6 fungal-type domain-containing protein n=1 Tax=Roridomyces roridus TaxID=1738132 RepID=A0AAD7FK63_9AGAR|nr:hypothetical protein FB45DRAFT_1080049 [Roridomyces roridus]